VEGRQSQGRGRQGRGKYEGEGTRGGGRLTKGGRGHEVGETEVEEGSGDSGERERQRQRQGVGDSGGRWEQGREGDGMVQVKEGGQG
jgi:hypothetical protein